MSIESGQESESLSPELFEAIARCEYAIANLRNTSPAVKMYETLGSHVEQDHVQPAFSDELLKTLNQHPDIVSYRALKKFILHGRGVPTYEDREDRYLGHLIDKKGFAE